MSILIIKLYLAHKKWSYLDIIGDCGISSRDNYMKNFYCLKNYDYINLVDIQKNLSTKICLFNCEKFLKLISKTINAIFKT